MPIWKTDPEQIKKNLLFPGFLLLIFVIYLFTSISSYIGDQSNYMNAFNIFSSTLLIVYISGRLYGEFNLAKDYIEITEIGVRFRSTPGFTYGWLPA